MTDPAGPKKGDEILRDMRREVEKAAQTLKKATEKVMARPETKEVLTKADHFLAKLARGTDIVIHELEKDFKDLATKLREAGREEPPKER
ncbi:MAG: hypothetical protein HYY06_22505 [Deltaproteobacteria bacterium]|nr:hypothetical protein [Deltaproteobacteria bacterium]